MAPKKDTHKEPSIFGGSFQFQPQRTDRKSLHRDLSTAILVPSTGMVPTKVVDSWMGLVIPPNQKVVRLFCAHMEVGAAYNELLNIVLTHPDLSSFKYILTLEEDNIPESPMALVQLLDEMDRGKWDVLGGLYFTKGEEGVPQLWGDPKDPEENYRPQQPKVGKVVRCNGTGMGFTLFRTELFRQLDAPWFETQAGEKGMWTQDLWFFHQARVAGLKLKVGVDCRVKVGHYDFRSGITW